MRDVWRRHARGEIFEVERHVACVAYAGDGDCHGRGCFHEFAEHALVPGIPVVGAARIRVGADDNVRVAEGDGFHFLRW